MPAKKHGPGIKNPEVYEELREDGASKEKAARISNAMKAQGAKKIGAKGGKAGDYDDWSVEDLRKRAGEIGIDGRSKMKKDELIDALRNH
jgi:hypothetical protein